MIEVRTNGTSWAVRWAGDDAWWVRFGNPGNAPTRMTAEAVKNWTEVAVPDVRVGQSVTSLDMGSG